MGGKTPPQPSRETKKPLTATGRILAFLYPFKKALAQGKESAAQERARLLQEKLNNCLDREACGLIDSVPDSLYDALSEAERAVAQEGGG